MQKQFTSCMCIFSFLFLFTLVKSSLLFFHFSYKLIFFLFLLLIFLFCITTSWLLKYIPLPYKNCLPRSCAFFSFLFLFTLVKSSLLFFHFRTSWLQEPPRLLPRAMQQQLLSCSFKARMSLIFSCNTGNYYSFLFLFLLIPSLYSLHDKKDQNTPTMPCKKESSYAFPTSRFSHSSFPPAWPPQGEESENNSTMPCKTFFSHAVCDSWIYFSSS